MQGKSLPTTVGKTGAVVVGHADGRRSISATCRALLEAADRDGGEFLIWLLEGWMALCEEPTVWMLAATAFH
jgi:hypothetical protein